jgi:hypothetical protein
VSEHILIYRDVFRPKYSLLVNMTHLLGRVLTLRLFSDAPKQSLVNVGVQYNEYTRTCDGLIPWPRKPTPRISCSRINSESAQDRTKSVVEEISTSVSKLKRGSSWYGLNLSHTRTRARDTHDIDTSRHEFPISLSHRFHPNNKEKVPQHLILHGRILLFSHWNILFTIPVCVTLKCVLLRLHVSTYETGHPQVGIHKYSIARFATGFTI